LTQSHALLTCSMTTLESPKASSRLMPRDTLFGARESGLRTLLCCWRPCNESVGRIGAALPWER
jgi:hypothetical protein